MNVPQLIIKKRDGGVLSTEEIRGLIEGFTAGTVPPYQVASLLMAVYFRGMKDYELDAWTEAMIRSGRSLNLEGLTGPKIDKHSTGGVGDKVSLSLAPIAAACGVCVPMISGRGLGHTGGTLDKLESLGMNVQLDGGSLRKVLEETGLVFAGQTQDICPADRKLYSLRDVTGTVESIPLIASSIMSKKLAEGIDGLVLDIKVGRGAFMKDRQSAALLARTMQRIGEGKGVKVKAILTAMDQPLGRACGNSVEVAEAIEMLQGKGPEDYRELVLHLTAWMLVLGGRATSVPQARAMCDEKIRSGEALERMRRVVAAQGGDSAAVDDRSRLPVGRYGADIKAPASGWVKNLDAYRIGLACVALGAGRVEADEKIDFGAGINLHRKTGDKVAQGEVLATLRTSSEGRLEEGARLALEAYEIGTAAAESPGSIILEEI
jgi:pyrimidine-nucleoside phosphorylase